MKMYYVIILLLPLCAYSQIIFCDTLYGNFLFENTVAYTSLSNREGIISRKPIFLYGEKVNYKKGVYVLPDQILSIAKINPQEIPRWDSISTQDLWRNTLSVMSDSSSKSIFTNSNGLEYVKVKLSLEVHYMGKHLFIVPQRNPLKLKRNYCKQKIPIYFISKVFSSNWRFL